MKSHPPKLQVFCATCMLTGSIVLAACSQNGAESGQAAAPSANSATVATTAASFAPFADTIPQAQKNTQCSLDLINGEAALTTAPVASGSTVIFGGWAGNGHGQAADKFELVLKGAQQSYAAPLTTGVERADVAKAWNNEDMAKSGYNLAATLTGVAAGTYSLYVADPTDTTADCDLHRTLTVQ